MSESFRFARFKVSEKSSDYVNDFIIIIIIIQLRDAFDFERDLLRSIPHLNVRDHGFPCLVHVPGPVILQLRLRGADILAAAVESTNELPDDRIEQLPL